ncbi:protein kinase PKP1 NDAI_0A02650 [Naumovozyma dairenensis CBS 421]|uniref:Protein-serine/threonine kinase n=1 Tax=Naumovozyma dairenensis (strain ATCC 10597 / BCRC 20456 / CBS 421 / NBRC 0211 / NRRL Y-12639) TaxID=1071378 RepID=G0W3N5_NAUDC|nr:hypothetical protein NDAI_0A02650 [Naumovozyma dairenensis CBS 421]CCD22423.1 hypothetical protein NDAI_0A02650 [Naumovozyma dairenensis CBS 421]
MTSRHLTQVKFIPRTISRSPYSCHNFSTKSIVFNRKVTHLHQHHQHHHPSAKTDGIGHKSLTEPAVSHLDFQTHYKIRTNIELLIQDYSRKPIPPLSYGFLTNFKKKPLTSNEKYNLTIKTINYLISYTCRQLNSIQNLPYIVITNPKINQINSLYLRTLEALLSKQFPYDLYNDDLIIDLLKKLNNEHNDNLILLSNGLKEIHQDLLSRKKIFKFLDDHIKDRMSMKLIISNYLSLLAPVQLDDDPNMIGIVHKNLKISTLINQTVEFVNDLCQMKYNTAHDQISFQTDKRKSSSSPPSMIKYLYGEDLTFPCIPIILEYIFTELFKNSIKAQLDHNVHKPIEVSLFQTDSNELTIKLRDFGKGINPNIESEIFQYSFTSSNERYNPIDDRYIDTNENALNKHSSTVEHTLPQAAIPGSDDVNNNTISGMGYGLPLSKNYLKLFQGDINIQSLWGVGTDVYIKLKGPSQQLLKGR